MIFSYWDIPDKQDQNYGLKLASDEDNIGRIYAATAKSIVQVCFFCEDGKWVQPLKHF